MMRAQLSKALLRKAVIAATTACRCARNLMRWSQVQAQPNTQAQLTFLSLLDQLLLASENVGQCLGSAPCNGKVGGKALGNGTQRAHGLDKQRVIPRVWWWQYKLGEGKPGSSGGGGGGRARTHHQLVSCELVEDGDNCFGEPRVFTNLTLASHLNDRGNASNVSKCLEVFDCVVRRVSTDRSV